MTPKQSRTEKHETDTLDVIKYVGKNVTVTEILKGSSTRWAT